MRTDSFIVSIKTDDIYKDIAEDVETRFDTSKYELDKSLPEEDDEDDDGSGDKKKQKALKVCHKKKLKFENYKTCFEATHLEITEVVLLVHWNIVKNDYQQNSRVWYKFVPNKLFGQLLDISPKKIIFLKIFNSGFSSVEVLFTDQNSKTLEIEDKINITLVILNIILWVQILVKT